MTWGYNYARLWITNKRRERVTRKNALFGSVHNARSHTESYAARLASSARTRTDCWVLLRINYDVTAFHLQRAITWIKIQLSSNNLTYLKGTSSVTWSDGSLVWETKREGWMLWLYLIHVSFLHFLTTILAIFFISYLFLLTCILFSLSPILSLSFSLSLCVVGCCYEIISISFRFFFNHSKNEKIFLQFVPLLIFWIFSFQVYFQMCSYLPSSFYLVDNFFSSTSDA